MSEDIVSGWEADAVRALRAERDRLQAEIEVLRGRDAKPFDWSGIPTIEEWIEENLPEREPRAGSMMVELHADEVVADRGEARRVAGWLRDLLAENEKLRAGRDRLQALLETLRVAAEAVLPHLEAMHSDGDYPCPALFSRECTCGAQVAIDAGEKLGDAILQARLKINDDEAHGRGGAS